jgi:hypothetical protein
MDENHTHTQVVAVPQRAVLILMANDRNKHAAHRDGSVVGPTLDAAASGTRTITHVTLSIYITHVPVLTRSCAGSGRKSGPPRTQKNRQPADCPTTRGRIGWRPVGGTVVLTTAPVENSKPW